MDLVSKGQLSPVFFGSALTNFGVEIVPAAFSSDDHISAAEKSQIKVRSIRSLRIFSAFVFKIQANMNKAHRDRIAFMRICSGQFKAGMEVFHVQGNKQYETFPAAAADGTGA